MQIILADDQGKVRSALRLLLEQHAGFQIIAETGSRSELAVYLYQYKPDLVLLDWELPGLDSAAGVRALQSLSISTRFVAMSSRPESAQEALNARVDAFISKTDPPEKVLRVVSLLIPHAKPQEKQNLAGYPTRWNSRPLYGRCLEISYCF